MNKFYTHAKSDHFRDRKMSCALKDEVAGTGEPPQWSREGYADLPEDCSSHAGRSRYSGQGHSNRYLKIFTIDL